MIEAKKILTCKNLELPEFEISNAHNVTRNLNLVEFVKSFSIHSIISEIMKKPERLWN